MLLDIKDMSDEDKLFNFLSGLQPWAQIEVRRQGAKDLPSAIATAEALVDLRLASASEADKSKPRPKAKKRSSKRRSP